jgi:hypothetical protein
VKSVRIALVCVTLAYTTSVYPTPPVPTAPAWTTCSKALHACIDLNTAYQSQVDQLKLDQAKLADALAKANSPGLLPTWAWVVIGVTSGIVLGTQLRK